MFYLYFADCLAKAAEIRAVLKLLILGAILTGSVKSPAIGSETVNLTPSFERKLLAWMEPP